MAATATTSELLQLAGAWREQLRADSAARRGVGLSVARRGDRAILLRAMRAQHCAELVIECARAADAAPLAARLGELLRLVRLAAAPHVDPIVLNALWDDDAHCAMGPARCARCDDAEHAVAPVVTLAIARPRNLRGDAPSRIGVIRDALFEWQDASATPAFRALRDALASNDGADRRAPRVELTILLDLSKDDGAAVLRDLPTLAARSRASTEADPCRLARVLPFKNAAEVTTPHYAALHTAIVDAGISTRLAPRIRDGLPPETARRAWQWLLDSATAAPLVDDVTLVYRPGQTPEMVANVLERVVTNNATLRDLTLRWPLHAQSDLDARRRAAEAIGAGLLAPHACCRVHKLNLDLGELTVDDVAALERGVAVGTGRDNEGSAAAPRPRFQSVLWNAQRTPEALVERIARLLGAVGTCELEITTDDGETTCRTLKTVLEHCAESLTALTWSRIRCDDTVELEATWSKVPRQLRKLRVFVGDESDPNSLRALDALLAHVGSLLTSLFVASTSPEGLTARAAEIIVARCPQLRALEVGMASAPFYEHLFQAYEDGRCGVSTLAVHAPYADVYWLPLLEALQDTTRAVTRKLRVLDLYSNWRYETPAGDAVFPTLLETLSTNTTLTRVVLWGGFNLDAQQQLRALPHQLAIRPPSLRRRLAFVSVCDGHDDRRLAKLSRDVLDVVFGFAGRQAPRYDYPC